MNEVASGPVPGRFARVALWDPRPDRAAVVAQVAAALGLGVHAHAAWCNDDAGSPPRLALVALGAEPQSQSDALAWARTARKLGYALVAYEDGVSQWPLADRSRALLAGPTRLLDSAAPGFRAELGLRLAELLRVAQRQTDQHAALSRQMHDLGIIGPSVAMRRTFAWAVRVSQFSDFSVLLAGETGTGKDLLARAIHRLDPRRAAGPFVPVNCAALAKTLAETELFGHRRGAFTGAEHDRRGLVRAADKGILFLDEVGELDLEVQAKLLRVLQEGRVLAVGDERDVAVDVRVVAATHRDLPALVAAGQFREDLFHRLAGLALEVPPLRERAEDIGPLVAFFLEKYARPGAARVIAGAEFIEALAQLGLPGNVRQLDNIVRRAVVQREDDADDGPLGLRDLSHELWQRLATARAPAAAAPCPAPDAPDAPESSARLLAAHDWNLARALATCERRLVEAAIERTQGNQSEAARLLGVTPRSVYNKLRKHHGVGVARRWR